MSGTSDQEACDSPDKHHDNHGRDVEAGEDDFREMINDRDRVTAENEDVLSRLTNTVFIRSIALTGIFIILLLHTLQVAAPVLIPITLAYILSLLLAPVVRRMRKLHIPEPLSAAIVLVVFLAVTASGIYGLSTPAREWSGRVPELVQKIDNRLRPLSEPIKEAKDAAEKVSKITESEDKNSEPGNYGTQQVTVTVDDQSWMADLLSGTPRVLANVGIVIVLMYFLLAGGDSALNKVVSAIPKLKDKKRAVSIMRDIQTGISHYLFTCTVINATLGLVVATALYFLGMPNPILWGALVGLLNFAPYIGPALSLIIVTPVAVLSFPALGQALLVPLVVFSINILEGQLITPQIMGRRLALSPVVVFISIVVWGWLWGVPGALMAIPIVAAVKIICERIDVLNPISDFIGTTPRAGRRAGSQAAV